MKLNVILFCLLSVVLFPGCGDSQAKREGTSYYFDAENGNDENTGLSENEAWKTIGRVKDTQLNPGDSLLLRSGHTFSGILEISGRGRSDCRIIVDAYGSGSKPCITGPDSSLFAVQVKNSDYLTVQNLEIINNGTSRLPRRTGIKVVSENHGISHGITLNALDIHDVNGSLIKKEGGGSGILIVAGGKEIPSSYDSLLIENCVIRRCERNAIIWSAPYVRSYGRFSTNTIVRKNLIEEVPGDGIVPIACEGALVEYNLMRNCPMILLEGEAAAGIWPWSCDNTILQFNEVSDHKAPWDGQGFDADFNSTNTIIQYNYSHDNHGGLVLICTPEIKNDNIGNIGSVVQYNVSINDGRRPNKTHTGNFFSPIIHVAGPNKNARINNNILHMGTRANDSIDYTIIESNSWDGYADSTFFVENVCYAPEQTDFEFTESTHNYFSGNYYLGKFANKPTDEEGNSKSAYYDSLLKTDITGFKSLSPLFDSITIADGKAYVMAVNKKAIANFFVDLKDK